MDLSIGVVGPCLGPWKLAELFWESRRERVKAPYAKTEEAEGYPE